MNELTPSRTIDQKIQEQGREITRVEATHCIDMLAAAEERKKVLQGENVIWLTPG